MNGCAEFNINKYVKIKLSEYGRRILEKHYGWKIYHIPDQFKNELIVKDILNFKCGTL